MKQYLDNDIARPLLDKIISETKSGDITWYKEELDEKVEIPEQFKIPLTTARPNYHFVAELSNNFYCHFQHMNSLYFIWFTNEKSGFACFEGHLFKTPGFSEGIIELADAIRDATYSEKGILDDIDAYLKG